MLLYRHSEIHDTKDRMAVFLISLRDIVEFRLRIVEPGSISNVWSRFRCLRGLTEKKERSVVYPRRCCYELTIFGSTGGTGRELTKQATAAGHEIQALTRSPGKLPSNDAVTAIQGNVLEPEAVSATVDGADAVVCLLGRTPNNPEDVVSRGTENIVDSMDEQGVERLVALTSMWLGARVRQVPWYVRIANVTVLHDLRPDKARQEEIVMGSDLGWTIIRPGKLTDGPRTGEYVHGIGVKATAGPISRANVADFLLQVVQTDDYLREVPILTTRRGVDAEFLREQITGVSQRLRNK